MERTLTGQVTRRAADVYEAFFVPALFAQWAAPMIQAARLGPGQTVLDFACGTGVLAREAARRVAPDGSVIGLDRNEGMLAVRILPSNGNKDRRGRCRSGTPHSTLLSASSV